MMRVLSVLAAIAVGATAVYAQSAAIGQRKEILKTFGGAFKEPGQMMKGEAAFDLAKVQASLKTVADFRNHTASLGINLPCEDSIAVGEASPLAQPIWTPGFSFSIGQRVSGRPCVYPAGSTRRD